MTKQFNQLIIQLAAMFDRIHACFERASHTLSTLRVRTDDNAHVRGLLARDQPPFLHQINHITITFYSNSVVQSGSRRAAKHMAICSEVFLVVESRGSWSSSK